MKKTITLDLDQEDLKFIKTLSAEAYGFNSTYKLEDVLKTTLKEYMNKAYRLGKEQSQYD